MCDCVCVCVCVCVCARARVYVLLKLKPHPYLLCYHDVVWIERSGQTDGNDYALSTAYELTLLTFGIKRLNVTSLNLLLSQRTLEGQFYPSQSLRWHCQKQVYYWHGLTIGMVCLLALSLGVV